MSDSVCYICLEGGGAHLVKACDCHQPAHAECLQNWIRYSRATTCSVCKASYRTLPARNARSWTLSDVGLIALSLCHGVVIFYLVWSMFYTNVQCKLCLAGAGATFTVSLSYTVALIAHRADSGRRQVAVRIP